MLDFDQMFLRHKTSGKYDNKKGNDVGRNILKGKFQIRKNMFSRYPKPSTASEDLKQEKLSKFFNSSI